MMLPNRLLCVFLFLYNISVAFATAKGTLSEKEWPSVLNSERYLRGRGSYSAKDDFEEDTSNIQHLLQTARKWNQGRDMRKKPNFAWPDIEKSRRGDGKRIKVTPKLSIVKPSDFKSKVSDSLHPSFVFQERLKRRRIREKTSNLSIVHNLSNAKTILGRKPRSIIRSNRCGSEFTCWNKCSLPRSSIYENTFKCYCDADCEFFKDCCADYGSFCKGEDNWWNQTNNDLNNTNNDGNSANNGTKNLVGFNPFMFRRKKRSMALEKSLWDCFSYPYMNASINGIWMIGSCPTTWPKDNIFYQCRNLSVTNKITKDNYRYLPVYTSNGTVYHNRFCAQCNGVALDQLKSYQLSMNCITTPSVDLSPSKTLDFLFDHCIGMSWEPQGLSLPRRYCLMSEEICSIPTSKMKCKHSPVRIVSYRSTFYKNVFCAECNDRSKSDLKCGPSHNDTFPNPSRQVAALSVIFDFSGVFRGKVSAVKCPRDEVYDNHLGICRETLAAAPKSSGFTKYEVATWFKTTFKGFCPIEPLTEDLARTLELTPAQVNITRQDIVFLLLLFEIRLNKSSVLPTFLQNVLHFQSPFNSTLGNCKVTIIKSTKRLLSCSNLQVFKRSEYTILRGSGVVIKSTGELLQSNDYYIDGEPSSPSQSVLVCRQNQALSCSKTWVLMNEGEFIVLKNKSVFVNSSARFYNTSEYIWQNRSLFICENFGISGVESKKGDRALIVLTIVCMLISIIALAFVLVTYSLFTELRTPPGINLMNLSVAILLSQLLWLFVNWQTSKGLACTVIAVLLHYFFLVSFVWTSIIAFDTWRTFTAKGRRSMADSKRKRLLNSLRYMGVGWLSVMVYVSICFALDLTNTVTIGYQSSEVCWMSNPWSVLLFFAIPVGMILLSNIIMYFLTMRAIKTTTSQARAATDHKKNTFGIYVRIASAMGFTWLIGFIAPFEGKVLWYLFTILNGLQGVYIALSFVVNRRVMKMYKRLLGQASTPIRAETRTQISSGTENKAMDTKF